MRASYIISYHPVLNNCSFVWKLIKLELFLKRVMNVGFSYLSTFIYSLEIWFSFCFYDESVDLYGYLFPHIEKNSLVPQNYLESVASIKPINTHCFPAEFRFLA